MKDQNTAKRGRGRPAKSNALSNAERQRRWRERQKRLRDQKPTADHQTIQALDQEVRKLLVELERANARVAELEKELAGEVEIDASRMRQSGRCVRGAEQQQNGPVQ